MFPSQKIILRPFRCLSSVLSLALLLVAGSAVTEAVAGGRICTSNDTFMFYFMSSLLPDIQALDSGHFPGWVRTGRSFKAYLQQATGASPVCRFYMPAPQDSHFYSPPTEECTAVGAKYPTFVFEAPDVFYISLPDTATGTCPSATVPVFPLYNNRVDANHRYTTDPPIKAQMTSQGYIAEGYGPSATIMCAPQ
jgi:hypothetical protein